MTNQNEPAMPVEYLSAREHAAIQLRVPNSGTPWLDEMIRKSLRQEFAKAAMQGLIASPRVIANNSNEPIQLTPENYAVACVVSADALIAELEKKP